LKNQYEGENTLSRGKSNICKTAVILKTASLEHMFIRKTEQEETFVFCPCMFTSVHLPHILFLTTSQLYPVY